MLLHRMMIGELAQQGRPCMLEPVAPRVRKRPTVRRAMALPHLFLDTMGIRHRSLELKITTMREECQKNHRPSLLTLAACKDERMQLSPRPVLRSGEER